MRGEFDPVEWPQVTAEVAGQDAKSHGPQRDGVILQTHRSRAMIWKKVRTTWTFVRSDDVHGGTWSQFGLTGCG